MLIRFTVENFRSFNQETTFSMIPGRMQKHAEHIISNPASGFDALPLALIYGANAAGKSNLVRAMQFARKLIIKGLRAKELIPVQSFRLNPTGQEAPSHFEFEFVVQDKAYSYGFTLTPRRIIDEWLYEVTAQTDTMLFERKTDKAGQAEATFGKPIKEDTELLGFVARGTRPNQLLLTELIDKNMTIFQPIHDWFQHSLVIIFPDSRFKGIQGYVHHDQPFTEALGTFLQSMDTGIDEVCTRAIDPTEIFRTHQQVEEALDSVVEDSTNGEDDAQRWVLLDGSRGERYIVRRLEQGKIEALSLGTKRYIDDKPVEFDIWEESDGTKRLLDLFPVLHAPHDKVFVIDELERSLHPNLVQRFLQQFLASPRGKQLVVTTHEATLLDLTLLRRDEIWFVEKDEQGGSALYSLEEFKPRNDLDIRKGYLHGRFGAIPVFGSQLQLDPELSPHAV